MTLIINGYKDRLRSISSQIQRAKVSHDQKGNVSASKLAMAAYTNKAFMKFGDTYRDITDEFVKKMTAISKGPPLHRGSFPSTANAIAFIYNSWQVKHQYSAKRIKKKTPVYVTFQQMKYINAYYKISKMSKEEYLNSKEQR